MFWSWNHKITCTVTALEIHKLDALSLSGKHVDKKGKAFPQLLIRWKKRKKTRISGRISKINLKQKAALRKPGKDNIHTGEQVLNETQRNKEKYHWAWDMEVIHDLARIVSVSTSKNLPWSHYESRINRTHSDCHHNLKWWFCDWQLHFHDHLTCWWSMMAWIYKYLKFWMRPLPKYWSSVSIHGNYVCEELVWTEQMKFLNLNYSKFFFPSFRPAFYQSDH